MDVDELFLQMREDIAAIISKNEWDENFDNPELVDLANKFNNLDEWIKNGGYLPASWQLGHKRNK